MGFFKDIVKIFWKFLWALEEELTLGKCKVRQSYVCSPLTSVAWASTTLTNLRVPCVCNAMAKLAVAQNERGWDQICRATNGIVIFSPRLPLSQLVMARPLASGNLLGCALPICGAPTI